MNMSLGNSSLEVEANTSGLVQSLPPALATSAANLLANTVTNITLRVWDIMDFSQVLEGPGCTSWLPLHHLYYQLAHLALLVSCLAPGGPAGLLCLRLSLLVAFSLYCGWGWCIACSPDTVLWGILLALANLCWLLVLLWRVRPVLLVPDLEEVYTQLFLPLKVSRRQFQQVLGGCRDRRTVGAKESVIQEKVSRVNSLSLVLSGRLLVSQAGRPLHVVSENQFLDSPEWFGVTTDDYFQVTVTALEECRLLVWHRDRLKFHLMEDTFLQAVFDHVLGRDVVKKLMQVQSEEVCTPTTEDWDDKTALMAKQAGLEQGLVASLLSMRGDLRGLGNIQETEDETLV